MTKPDDKEAGAQGKSGGDGHDDEDLNDLLQEARILLQGAQVLTAFLVILPFNEGFAKIGEAEKWVYLATFVCSLTGLVLFSAPAAQHRIARPLRDRVRFKNFATRITIMGLVPTSLALVLVTEFVVNEVFGLTPALIVAGGVLAMILFFWWILPLARKGDM